MRLLEGTTEAAPQVTNHKNHESMIYEIFKLILQIWIQLEKMTKCAKILNSPSYNPVDGKN